MTLVGLDPNNTRDLSTTMKTTAATADGLGSEVTAALTLSQLESPIPGHLINIGEELDQVSVVLAARADIAEGFVIDPTRLAADLGITVEQAEKAIAKFEPGDTGTAGESVDLAGITPFLDVLVANQQAAAHLAAVFVNLPPPGENPEFDQAFNRMAPWLLTALEKGKLPSDLDRTQVADLMLLNSALDPGGTKAAADGLIGAFGALVAFKVGADRGLDDLSGKALRLVAKVAFKKVEKAFELDSRLTKAAGLPTVEDMVYEYGEENDIDFDMPDEWASLDDWLPAFLAGEGPASTDPKQLALAMAMANLMGWNGGPKLEKGSIFERERDVKYLRNGDGDDPDEIAAALDHLRHGRFLQRALIPGEFEDIASPMIPITTGGLAAAIAAGRRQGVLSDETRQRAEQYAELILPDPDGSGAAIELNDEQQQALIAAVAQQNGEAFIQDPQIQRQLVASLLRIGRKGSLKTQRAAFASTIEAFRSLATIGAPSMTYRQLKEAVGDAVDDELSSKDLRARSSDRVAKRPFYLSMLAQWGVPGSDKIKTKKRKFKFSFNDDGSLGKVRKKKISKWKRAWNTIKAIGKSLVTEWKDNPWKYLFLGYAGLFPGANQLAEGVKDGDFDDIIEGGWEMSKFAVTAAAAAFPPSSGPAWLSVAGAAVAAGETVEAIQDDNWLAAAGSAFGAIGGAASVFNGAKTAGTTANLIATGAEAGEQAVKTYQAGEGLVDAIDDGEIVDLVGSGLQFAGQAAESIVAGSQFANSVSVGLGGANLVSKPVIESIAGVGEELGELAGTTVGAGQIIDGATSGNALLLADGLVGAGQAQIDPESRLGGQLKVVDEALDVAHLVDGAYRGGPVPGLSALATEAVEVGGAVLNVPDAPVDPPTPTSIRGGPATGLLVDTDGDGIPDQQILLAGHPSDPAGSELTAEQRLAQLDGAVGLADAEFELQQQLVESEREAQLGALDTAIANLEQNGRGDLDQARLLDLRRQRRDLDQRVRTENHLTNGPNPFRRERRGGGDIVALDGQSLGMVVEGRRRLLDDRRRLLAELSDDDPERFGEISAELHEIDRAWDSMLDLGYSYQELTEDEAKLNQGGSLVMYKSPTGSFEWLSQQGAAGGISGLFAGATKAVARRFVGPASGVIDVADWLLTTTVEADEIVTVRPNDDGSHEVMISDNYIPAAGHASRMRYYRVDTDGRVLEQRIEEGGGNLGLHPRTTPVNEYRDTDLSVESGGLVTVVDGRIRIKHEARRFLDEVVSGRGSISDADLP